MGLSSYCLAGVALLASSAFAQTAQVVSYSNNNYGISVNVPDNTASSGSGSIYFQISAPSGTQWVGFGQGNRMSGSNMFIVYARDSTNVTISPRSGTGHVMPQYNSDAQITLLAGSGITSGGSMVANIRCDSCLSWSGGSMDPTSSSSNWIWAHKSGSALNTNDVSASISQHNSDGTFTLDLTKGTGGNSVNPFVAAEEPSSSSSSASASGTTTATSSGASTASSGTTATRSSTAAASGTNSVSVPLATSGSNSNTGNSNSGSSSNGASTTTTSNTPTLESAHGILMSVLFLGLFPFFSLTLYLPTAIKVRYIHAPLQILATILLIVGMALGIVLGQRIGQLDGYHMVIGFTVVACLVLFQPAMGVYQHLHYSRTGGRSIFGQIHRWLGRTLIALGIVNGGLGWMIAGTTSAYAPYGVVAGIVVLVYIAVLVFASRRTARAKNVESEKGVGTGSGFEMQSPKSGHKRLPSEEAGGAGTKTAYREQKNVHGASYTTQDNRF